MIEGQEITPEQFKQFSELAAKECPDGMKTEADLEELLGWVLRASFPTT
jgi:hypothetical protein